MSDNGPTPATEAAAKHAEPANNARLFEALSKAQERAKEVSKDSYNPNHKYNYASTDDIVAACKEASTGLGLSVRPISSPLVRENGTVVALVRKVMIAHSSGEETPCEVEWPVPSVEKYRPLDKAVAIALTSSLGYLLRDIYQLPRVEAEDMDNAKNDRPEKEVSPANEADMVMAEATKLAKSLVASGVPKAEVVSRCRGAAKRREVVSDEGKWEKVTLPEAEAILLALQRTPVPKKPEESSAPKQPHQHAWTKDQTTGGNWVCKACGEVRDTTLARPAEVAPSAPAVSPTPAPAASPAAPPSTPAAPSASATTPPPSAAAGSGVLVAREKITKFAGVVAQAIVAYGVEKAAMIALVRSWVRRGSEKGMIVSDEGKFAADIGETEYMDLVRGFKSWESAAREALAGASKPKDQTKDAKEIAEANARRAEKQQAQDEAKAQVEADAALEEWEAAQRAEAKP